MDDKRETPGLVPAKVRYLKQTDLTEEFHRLMKEGTPQQIFKWLREKTTDKRIRIVIGNFLEGQTEAEAFSDNTDFCLGVLGKHVKTVERFDEVAGILHTSFEYRLYKTRDEAELDKRAADNTLWYEADEVYIRQIL